MMTNVLDNRLMLNRAFWGAIIAVGAIASGYLLAHAPFQLMFALAGLIWLLTLPHHGTISVFLGVSTFSAALILPFFPGRPYLWEFAALLAWSGLVLMISMRRHAPDFLEQIRENRWLFIGAFAYCIVLLITMRYRGVGFRVLGGDQMGGRYYFQQITCAIFPLIFILVRPKEKMLVRLFTLQCLLTATYLISDFAFSVAPRQLFIFLQFFELAGDAANFETLAGNFGIRRFQSFVIVAQGYFYLLLIYFNLRDFVGRRAIWLTPLGLAILAIGLPSGYRWLWVIVPLVLIFCGYAQRFFTLRSVLIVIVILTVLLPVVYAFADRLPLAGQRVASLLPGINISDEARMDGHGTLAARRFLRKVGFELMPSYFWIGRGFGFNTRDLSAGWDPTGMTTHIQMGRFFNGFVGLMVNTGVFGTIFMMIFLTSGTVLAWKIIQLLRKQGCEDSFTRMSSIVASVWMANVISFLFLHGDSEWAMKGFSLQAGMLLVAHYHLKKRELSAAA